MSSIRGQNIKKITSSKGRHKCAVDAARKARITKIAAARGEVKPKPKSISVEKLKKFKIIHDNPQQFITQVTDEYSCYEDVPDDLKQEICRLGLEQFVWCRLMAKNPSPKNLKYFVRNNLRGLTKISN